MITKKKNQEIQQILRQRAKDGDLGMFCYKCQKKDHRRQDCFFTLCSRCYKWVDNNHNCPSNNSINISQLIKNSETPTYVMNVIYNDVGIFLSKRIDKRKEMYNLWQVPGGKVEENEYSIEAILRETEEETGLIIKKDIPQLIFNDPKFNCDVYITKVSMNTTLRNTEPNKQSSWILNTFKQYEEKCKRKEITPTHVKYMQKILESLKISTTIAQAQWEERRPQDAYFAEAEVFGRKINVMIDTGAVGCIITKSFLDSVHKEIEASTNVQIVSVTGAKTAPLGKMFKVGVKIGKFEIKEDMIVTEASGYNILLGNDWITNQAKAIINTEKQIMTIKQNKEIDIVPITCFTKMNPVIFTPIDFLEEEYDELELEESEGEPQHYLNVSLEENIATINHQQYPTEFLEFSNLEFLRTDKHWKGPGRCLCKVLQNNEKCLFCRKLQEDLNDYHVAKAQIEEDDEVMKISTGKETTIGSLSNNQRIQLQDLLTRNNDLFATDKSELTQTNIAQHSIITEDIHPIKKRAYSTSPKEKEWIATEIDEMLQQGVIQPSSSPWSAPIVLVKKKNGQMRMCVNYKDLNNITKKDNYPLPRIDELLDSLQGSRWFTSLDLFSGFWQIKIRPEDVEKTAFITSEGLYEFVVMPFGLCNAPATFQRTMDTIFQKEKRHFIKVYMDDLNIHSKTFEEHLQHLQITFDRIRAANLRIKPDKCHFCSQEIKFLGHVVNEQGIQPDPSKITKVANYPVPRNLTELRAFLGLASYYRRFIKDFSKISSPLYKLTEKETLYQWSDERQRIFDVLKEKLTTAPILIYPNFDQPFTLYTDASQIGLGAVLSQKGDDGKEHVIVYASRSLNPAEKNYSTTEQECLAIVWAVKYFKHYIFGSKFTIVTDHSALQWLLNSDSKVTENKRIMRWRLTLQEYSYEVKYRKGKNHENADALSRINPNSFNSTNMIVPSPSPFYIFNNG